MLTIQVAMNRSKYSRSILQVRLQSTETQLQPAEAVEYPQIQDLSPKAVYRRQQEEYFEKIKNLGSVEEKLYALNLPKYYGWPSFYIKESLIPYNFLPFTQYVTRTVISENKNLPLYMTSDNLERLKNRVKSELERVLIFENSIRQKRDLERQYVEEDKIPFYSPGDLKNFKVKHMVKQLNSAFVRSLAPEYPHLFQAQVDMDPRLESFWRVGGFYPTEADIKLRKDKEIHESMVEDPIDRFFQYFGSPILQLRGRNPLPPLPKIPIKFKPVEIDEEQPEVLQLADSQKQIAAGTENVPAKEGDTSKPEKATTQLAPIDDQGDIRICDEDGSYFYPWQEYRYMPDLYLDLVRERCHGTVIPGFWPNDSNRFGVVSFHSSTHMEDRPPHYGAEDAIEALHAQAVLASYAWTYGQACYQGFTTYNDITYPLPTQTVLTDGKVFSFYQYQLNTMVLHSEHNEPENTVYNECYATSPMELFHQVGVDKIEGWNDDALLNLLAIYTNTPTARTDIDLCPYLNKQVKYISQMEDKEMRVWWDKKYRHQMSRRPRHKKDPEIYDWERIYKIENKVRFKDARKRFFEIFQDPINDRRVGQDVKEYIPKNYRPNKREGRIAKDFYPDVFPAYHEIV